MPLFGISSRNTRVPSGAQSAARRLFSRSSRSSSGSLWSVLRRYRSNDRLRVVPYTIIVPSGLHNG